jgi:hypothetical protein
VLSNFRFVGSEDEHICSNMRAPWRLYRPGRYAVMGFIDILMSGLKGEEYHCLGVLGYYSFGKHSKPFLGCVGQMKPFDVGA